MPDPKQPIRRRWLVALVGLRVSAEAGWLTVVYAALAVLMGKRDPILGPAELGLLVVGGFFIGRFGRRHPELGAVLLLAGAVAGGVLGWLGSPEARDLMGLDLGKALGAHLAGWIGGVAVLRGTIITADERAAFQLEGLLKTVPAALGFVWAYTTFAARADLWLAFAISAMWGTVLFLSTGLVGMGMARLNELHREVDDVRQKRAWRWLVMAVGFGIVPVAIPLAILSGIPLSDLMNPVVGPAQWVIGLLRFPLMLIIGLLTEVLRPVAPGLGDLLDQLGAAIARRQEEAEQPQETSTIGVILGLVLWIVTVLIVAFALYRIARWLLTRKQLIDEEVADTPTGLEHEIVLPTPPERPVPAAVRRRRPAAHDAVTAYVEAVAELEQRPDLARQPAETPAAHAARLRGMETQGVDLSRLAADYQLARYAGRPISHLENIRALTRLQRIRRLLRAG